MEKTKICKKCGRELSLEMFSNDGHGGLRDFCKNCHSKMIEIGRNEKRELKNAQAAVADARNLRIQDFTPRELMTELARRGYRGKLTYTKVETIDIGNF